MLQYLHRWKREEHGSVLIFVAVAAFVLLIVTGLSIDMARTMLVRSKIITAIDAAALAAASVARTQDVTRVANGFFEANFPMNYLGTTLNPLQIMAFDEAGNVLSVTDPAQMAAATRLNVQVTGIMPSSIMSIVGVNDVEIATESEVLLGRSREVEIAMTMDISGSMCRAANASATVCAVSNTRLDALKATARTFVQGLTAGGGTLDNAYVTLLPYNLHVNRPGRSYDFSDNRRTYEFSPAELRDIANSTNNSFYSELADRCEDPTVAGAPDSAVGQRLCAHAQDDRMSRLHPDFRDLTPFTDNLSRLVSDINALDAVGGTDIGYAMRETERAIDPANAGQFSHTITPSAFNDPDVVKIVILMTDGYNQRCFDYPAFDSSLRLPDGPANENDCVRANSNADNATRQACQSLADEGVNIFAISFAQGSDARSQNAKNILRDCATRPIFYFDAPDAPALQEAFTQISNFLNDLRIVR